VRHQLLPRPGDRAGRASRLAEAIVSLSPFGQKMTKQVYRANVAFLEKRRPNFTGR
jgi:hypothetical protein